jgi:hypothetical protein
VRRPINARQRHNARGGAAVEVELQAETHVGLLLFLYCSRAVTSGSVYGVVLLSLDPIEYTISHIRAQECRTIVPISIVARDVWVKTATLPVQAWIADKHSDRFMQMSGDLSDTRRGSVAPKKAAAAP